MGGVAVVVLASTFGKKATPAWCSAWVEGAKGNIAATGRAGRFNNSLAGPYIVNIVGGIKISEPAADLAVCMAIASAAKGMQLSQDAVVFGEVGLSGEVRHVPNIEKRLKEAKQLGFNICIGPKTDKKSSQLHPVANLREALNTYLKT